MKLFNQYHMEQQQGKWAAALLGITGGMAKWVHLQIMGNSMELNRLIEPAVTAALCGFMGVFGKQLYKWSAAFMRTTGWPWLKSLLTKKR